MASNRHSSKFVTEEAMTSQKRDDVIDFFDALRDFFGQKGHRPRKSEHARTSMCTLFLISVLSVMISARSHSLDPLKASSATRRVEG